MTSYITLDSKQVMALWAKQNGVASSAFFAQQDHMGATNIVFTDTKITFYRLAPKIGLIREFSLPLPR